MSFSNEVKASLCTASPKRKCCRKSLLYGYLYPSKDFSRDGIRVRFSECAVGDYIEKCISELFCDCIRSEKSIEITDEGALDNLFYDFDTDGGAQISTIVFECPDCSKAFMKGVFLSSGSISDPARGYHMEFASLGEEKTEEYRSFLFLQGIPMRIAVRRGRSLLYCKSSEIIERYLSYIGAGKAVFGILNAKMLGETRSEVNRRSNFENANLTRTVYAASEQVKALEKLKSDGRYALLPEELRETARLRTENPDMSLSALAALHNPPITKSGLTHRLKKLTLISQEEK